MNRYREFPDGSIAFPRRGNIPENPDPYIWDRDTKDDYHFLPKLPACIYRETYLHVLPCGKTNERKRCQKGLEVSPTSCGLCDERKES
jgi:hypothetical protein